MRQGWLLVVVALVSLLGTSNCKNCGGGVLPGPPKTTIEPDGTSYKWTDDGDPAVAADPSGGKINSRFVNRKIDRLRACTTDPACTTASADERECTTAVFTREVTPGVKTEVTMDVVECAGGSGSLCIEWHLTGNEDALVGRSASNSRNLPQEFFPVETDVSSSLTCDTVPVVYVEIDWKGGA